MLQMVFEEHRKVFAKMVTKFGPGLDPKKELFRGPKKVTILSCLAKWSSLGFPMAF